jgi:O-acetyl-ADP-ribose deacetylase (regulator of RNase III)
MPLTIVRNDISKVKADAIVNSANKNPVCGGGAEYHIYEAAGYDKLLAAREKIGVLDVAEVAVSSAFALKAKYLIHVVGPKWNGGESGETSALASCYRRALEKALELGCESIAFPLISSGVFRFPKDSALKIALQAIGEFLQSHEMDVQLVVFDRKAFDVSEELCDDIQAYIDDNYVRERYSGVRESARWNENGVSADFEKCDFYENSFVVFNRAEASHAICELEEKSLEEMLASTGETFCSKLFSIIREKNLDDVEIYKRANLDRKHFSKIRSNLHYRPTKKTALALAIALHLDLDETKDLLSRAELALSPSSKGDLIVSYFIAHQKYDIWEINSMLFKFGQPTLGA